MPEVPRLLRWGRESLYNTWVKNTWQKIVKSQVFVLEILFLMASFRVLYFALGSFSEAFFFCNFYSNGRNADTSYISSIFPEGNKSSTDADENQSWKCNSIQTFAKTCLLAIKAGLICLLMFLPGALQHVPAALELAWNNVLLPVSLTSVTVPPDAKKFHSVLNFFLAPCTFRWKAFIALERTSTCACAAFVCWNVFNAFLPNCFIL